MDRNSGSSIHHHGVGSARSLRRALDELQPDSIIPLVAQPDMQPPVALLVYNTVKPREAPWFPFAIYSPEWQALQYALTANVQVQFMDLPQKHMLAKRAALVVDGSEGDVVLSPEPITPELMIRFDPLRALAEAAGYEDSER